MADPWVAAAAVAANALALAGLAAFVTRANVNAPWSSVETAARFIAASAVACAIGSLLFSIWFAVSGELRPGDLPAAVIRLGFAQLTGILTIAPLVLWCLAPREAGAWRAWRSRTAAGQFAALALLWGGLLMLTPDYQLRYFYLLLIPVIWIALRWSWPGALTAVLALHLGLVAAVDLRVQTPRFIDLQVLMLALALVAIVLGMTVRERGEAVRGAQERDAALARAQRSAMAGGLSSALAHELNQPITALVSYLRSAQILLGQDGFDARQVRDAVSKAADEALRTSAVLRRLRDFYQDREVRREPVALDETCAAAVAALEERARRDGIRVTLDLATAGASVLADRTHLTIVLFNLLSNAADAVMVREPARREIRVSSGTSGGAAHVVIEDSGEGVDAALAERLFEPFRTTKSDGMGLGLAISRELAGRFGAELRASRSPRLGGASFTLYLELA
jgi:signal transduction histidine kinase